MKSLQDSIGFLLSSALKTNSWIKGTPFYVDIVVFQIKIVFERTLMLTLKDYKII